MKLSLISGVLCTGLIFSNIAAADTMLASTWLKLDTSKLQRKIGSVSTFGTNLLIQNIECAASEKCFVAKAEATPFTPNMGNLEIGFLPTYQRDSYCVAKFYVPFTMQDNNLNIQSDTYTTSWQPIVAAEPNCPTTTPILTVSPTVSQGVKVYEFSLEEK